MIRDEYPDWYEVIRGVELGLHTNRQGQWQEGRCCVRRAQGGRVNQERIDKDSRPNDRKKKRKPSSDFPSSTSAQNSKEARCDTAQLAADEIADQAW